MADKDPVLSLSSTEFERRFFIYDGEQYELRSPEELSAKMVRGLNSLQKRVDTAGDLDDVDDQVDELEAALRDGVDMVALGIPEEVHERMTFGQYKLILSTFGKLMGNETPMSETP